MPAPTNSTRNEAKKSSEAVRAAGRSIAPHGAGGQQPEGRRCVTRAPPTRSATMPPSGRVSAPTRAPRNARRQGCVGELGLEQGREGAGVADERAEGADVEERDDPGVPVAGGAGEAAGSRPWRRTGCPCSARRARAASRASGMNIRPARSRCVPAPTAMTAGTTSWTMPAPRLPPAALRPSALPFSASGKKKEMFVIDEAKLPPPKPARAAHEQQQCRTTCRAG